jgi:hypothetical protein
MGEPGWGNAQSSVTESIGDVTRTEGTETSQYLEEKKENSIPGVAASEMGTAQTGRRKPFRGCGALAGEPRRVTKWGDSRRLWKVPPQRVKAP